MLERFTFRNLWSFRVSRVETILPREAIDEALELAHRWANVFPSKGTWIGNEYGVPSIVIRVDGTWSKKRGWRIFDFEDKPVGLGLSSYVSPEFAGRLYNMLITEWPKFRCIRTEEIKTDDELCFGPSLTFEEASRSNDLLLVRCRPKNTHYHEFESRSISTISHEGNKSCMADLGLGTIVRWIDDPSEEDGGYIYPPITESSVIRPIQGTRRKNVAISLSDVKHIKIPGRGIIATFNSVPIIKKKGDVVGIDRIKKLVSRLNLALCQPFHMPMHLKHLPGLNTIYRFYFGYSTKKRKYVPLGGVYNASKSLRVDGHTDAIFGPISFNKTYL